MRDYTRNQLVRRIELMEEWSTTKPQTNTSADCPPAGVRVHNIHNDDDHDDC